LVQGTAINLNLEDFLEGSSIYRFKKKILVKFAVYALSGSLSDGA